jgi:carbon monoxide dehydrogenase subunit G
MISKEISVFVARPVEEVFHFMNDFSRVQEWQEDVIRAEIHGDWAVGATGVFVQKLMGREINSDFEVTAYDPPNEVCFASTAGPVSFVGCQRCVAQEGGTLLTTTIEAEVGGFFKVAEGIVGNQLESSFQRDFDNLKALMEG